MANGIFGSFSGLIKTGAAMMGYTMPGWAKAGMGKAAHTFGSKGDAGGGGASIARERRAVDFGGSINMGQQKMIGPGEQKASAAVEYEDELAKINSILRLYAKADV